MFNLNNLPQSGKILALDLGRKVTGVAVSDAKQSVAFPRNEFYHKYDAILIEALSNFIVQEEAVGILIGMPYGLSGEENDESMRVELFVKKIAHFNLPIAIIDERFTSKQAKKQNNGSHSEAALILLNTYIDFKDNLIRKL